MATPAFSSDRAPRSAREPRRPEIITAEADTRTVCDLPLEERLLLDEFRFWRTSKRPGRSLTIDLQANLGEHVSDVPSVHGGAFAGGRRR
jgi:hypothetical protein